jgi:hypothetical protein
MFLSARKADLKKGFQHLVVVVLVVVVPVVGTRIKKRYFKIPDVIVKGSCLGNPWNTETAEAPKTASYP